MEVRILHIMGTNPKGEPVEALVINRDKALDDKEGMEPKDYVDVDTTIEEIQEITLEGDWLSCRTGTTFQREV